MGITLTDIKQLRDKTSAGFMDCKKALTEANGDFKEAEKILKKMGLAELAKRSGRTSSEGSVFVRVEGNDAVIIELSCETDFVAKTDDFNALGLKCTQYIIEHTRGKAQPDITTTDLTTISEAVNAFVTEAAIVLKEKCQCIRFEKIQKKDSQVFGSYTHGIPARLGAVVTVSSDKVDEGAVEVSESEKELLNRFAYECALHAVARTPLFLDPGSAQQQYIDEQKEIFIKQAEQTGKPPEILEKMITGKLNKHLQEVSFLTQAWVKDDKKTVQAVVAELKPKLEQIRIQHFVVFQLGSNNTSDNSDSTNGE